jgi:hypothetical protein
MIGRGFYWTTGDFPDLWDEDETARWLDEQCQKEVRKLLGLPEEPAADEWVVP